MSGYGVRPIAGFLICWLRLALSAPPAGRDIVRVINRRYNAQRTGRSPGYEDRTQEQRIVLRSRAGYDMLFYVYEPDKERIVIEIVAVKLIRKHGTYMQISFIKVAYDMLSSVIEARLSTFS